MSLLPIQDTPRISRHARLSERAAGALDALLVVVPENADHKVLSSLPESERWRDLHEQGWTESLEKLRRLLAGLD